MIHNKNKKQMNRELFPALSNPRDRMSENNTTNRAQMRETVRSIWMTELADMRDLVKEQERKTFKTSQDISKTIRSQQVEIIKLKEKKQLLLSGHHVGDSKDYQEVSRQRSMTCSPYTYAALKNEISDLEKTNAKLDKDIKETDKAICLRQREMPYVYEYRAMQNRMRAKKAKMEHSLESVSRARDEQMRTIDMLCERVNSMARLRISFHWKYRKSMSSLHSRRAVLNAVHRNEDFDDRDRKLYLLRGTLSEDEIPKAIEELRMMLENNHVLSQLRIPCLPLKVDSFLTDSKTTDIQKEVKCHVIISRLEQISGAIGLKSICRKYMENEMDNFEIFTDLYEKTKQCRDVLRDINSLRNVLSVERPKWEGLIRSERRMKKELIRKTNEERELAREYEEKVDNLASEIEGVKSELREVLLQIMVPQRDEWDKVIWSDDYFIECLIQVGCMIPDLVKCAKHEKLYITTK